MTGSEIVLVGRILLSAMFILASFSKFGDIAGTTGYFAGLGLPMPGLATWASGLFELIAGLCILVGFQTAIAAYLLAAFCLVAAYIGHYGQGGDDPMLVLMNMQALMKNIAIAGGFLVLAIHGPGSLSVDARRS
ncbi:DoxX family protein [Allomesorhizobium alhagi]|jgi:putative oxidoreductase|uniref:DoxX family protein n=1 Tax=Mesorhizobium alhagi CCNWXJ12-2 TaxID=1107882 RepID=H0HUT9_9HYPH|nr:DoxX family protein [Mesorhizobium alhagi]EHK55525.1 DoxX family protein [Mesorhizobium alhagi CCNWXJ12-2]